MMVPAIAFAWWFIGLPVPDATEAPVDDVVMSGERVKPKLVTPAMIAAAESFVRLPLGTERYAAVDGRPYVFVVERHYHPPGYVGGPTGWHNGVSMYELR
jgi:hypothetical protein